jgi:hypothetical protein
MKNILLFVLFITSLQAVCQNSTSTDSLDFGPDSLGVTMDYYHKDSVMERNNGMKFFAFLHRQNLETPTRCGQCFFLYVEATKTDYCVRESESCRTHKNVPVSVMKNNQEIGFAGLREVATIVIENKDRLRKSISKNPLGKGEIGYVLSKGSAKKK